MIQRRERARLRAMVLMQSRMFMTCHPPLKGTESEEFMAAMGNMARHAAKAADGMKTTIREWDPAILGTDKSVRMEITNHLNCRCTSEPIRFTMDPDPPKTLLARLADSLARFFRGSSATTGR